MLISDFKRSSGHRQNAASWIFTVLILTGVYFFLQSMSVPDTMLKKEENIDLLPLDIVNLQAFKKMDTAPEPKPREQAIDAKQMNSNSISEKSDDSELLKFFESDFSRKKVVPNLPTSTVDTKASDPKIELSESRSSVSVAQSAKKTPNTEFYKVPNLKRPSPGKISDVSVKMGKTSQLKIEKTGYTPSQKPISTIDDKKPVSPEIDVPIIRASKLGNGPADLQPIYKELIEWMKKNPAKLSSVIRTFMNRQNGDLTSMARVALPGRQFEIYLVCQEEQYEIKICIVEAAQATLLIDRGFRKQSNYFRIGNASRDKSGKIFSFGTSQESPSDERTDEFYRIFLTWWEQVNKNEKK